MFMSHIFLKVWSPFQFLEDGLKIENPEEPTWPWGQHNDLHTDSNSLSIIDLLKPGAAATLPAVPAHHHVSDRL